MNEEQKNIETCLPESILAEVANCPTDPQFVSLVNESLDPLQQQAVQQAGSDAYNEVVASHQPYTFTSQVAQMKSNLILLLRRFWRFPFGSGTIRSLSDMWAHYITRLQGSETYGIQSRLDQLTDLPSAPLLVADRKISAGECDVPDGMSLLQLVLSRISGITKLSDPYVWDVCYRDQLFNLCAALPGLNDLYLRCKRLTGYSYSADLEWVPSQITKVNGSSDVFELPDLERFEGSSYNGCPTKNQNFKIWRLPKMVYSRAVFASNCSWVEEIYTPSSKEIGGYAGAGGLRNYTALRKMTMGQIVTLGDHSADSFTESLNLIHLEICGNGGYLENSFSFAGWSPTNAIDASRTDLIEEGSTAANNLQQFLQNFRSFIVLRLANRKTTSALTLTLSAAVYNAVTGANSGWASLHTLAELGITDNDLTDLETELGITSATIYATWLDTYTGANGIHWDINKAN